MGKRRHLSRRTALQILYAHSFSGQEPAHVIDDLSRSETVSRKNWTTFARALTQGVLDNQETLDAHISQALEHWRIERLTRIDLLILRLALCEMREFGDIPVAVTINEYIELAKEFGTDESAAFVNGILDRLAKDNKKSEKPPETRSAAANRKGNAMSESNAQVLSTFVIAKQPGRYIGWPTAAVAPSGEILVAFSGDRDAHVCPFGKVQMVRGSSDAKNWGDIETICDYPLDDRDAGIVVTPQGNLLIAWFTSVAFETVGGYEEQVKAATPEIREQWLGSWTRRSTDGGKTWDAPVRTYGSAPHGPISLSDGRMLYVGRVNPHKDTELPVEESTDDGRSWQQIAAIQCGSDDMITGFHEPHVVETADGKLVAQYRYHGPDYPGNRLQHMRQAESADGGKTWTTLKKTPLVGYPPHLLRLADGRLLCVYGKRYAPYGEYACLSADGGATWDVDNEILLSPGTSDDLGYPASVQLADGTILTVYYQIDQPGEKTCLMGTLWRTA